MYQHIEKIEIKNHEYLVSIIIPVYNEEKTIYSILKSLPKNEKIEIIVIDDYSRDNSVSEIEKVKNNREIKLVKHKKNKGYGKAILTGIKKSKGQIIVTMDSDGQHFPDDIYTLVQEAYTMANNMEARLQEYYEAINGLGFERKDKVGKERK